MAENELRGMYEIHILEGESLLQELTEHKYCNIKGISKLQRKIKKDILFLSETLQRNSLKKEHLVCTNLHFYKALVEKTHNVSECEAVMETFSYTCDGYCKRLTVDIVSHKGQQWIKVIARNPIALQQIYKDGDTFGKRSIMDQAMSYVQAAAQNLHMYYPPQVEFSFVNGVPEEMKCFLEKLGIGAEGKVITLEKDRTNCVDSDSGDETDFICDIYTLPSIKQKSTSKLNLCVTTMIAYVSALTNGGCNSSFYEPILNQQADWERTRPVKPILTDLFEGKELICCSTAVEDFKNIINMVGGEEEKQRAAALLSIVTVVPDVTFTGLQPTGKIKKRSLVIFGTGHKHEAVTVTANKGFVHASKQKGMKFAVIIHESRALTERKEVVGAS